MDDEIHNSLCIDFKNKLSRGVMYNEIMQIIDSDKYKDIFTWHNKTYICDPLNDMCIYPILSNITTYIITTRKIALNNIDTILYTLFHNLRKLATITEFFSFYTASEIKIILNKNIDDATVFYNKCYIKNILIIICISHNNAVLFNYVFNYMSIHEMNILIFTPQTLLCQYYSLQKHNPIAMQLIIDNETLLIFRRSLRYAWIMTITV